MGAVLYIMQPRALAIYDFIKSSYLPYDLSSRQADIRCLLVAFETIRLG